MSTFRVVDLASQADEVALYTDGWSSSSVLTWLAQQGEVLKIPNPYDDSLYSFRSHAGIQTGFRLTEDGKLVIVGRDSTYRPI